MTDESTVCVRVAARDDFGDVLRLFTLMHSDEPIAVTGASNNDASHTFNEILADPRRRLIVATIDDAVIGTADLILVPNISREGRSWATVENVVVDPSYRRRGVARAMMHYLMQFAADSGCYKVQLISHSRRTAAHRLYESLGFDAPVRGFRKYLL